MASKLDTLKKDKVKNVMSPKISTIEEIKQAELAITQKAEGSQYKEIAVAEIELNDKNDYAINDTDEDIQSLADDIKINGLMHNIVISYRANGKYVLLSGERRLKAYKMLGQEDKKYKKIMCRILYGLDEIDEMIQLDAANLQARGANLDDKIMREAMHRYVNNLKTKYNISDKAAKKMLEKVSSASRTTIFRNLKLEESLDKELLDMMDLGVINKAFAMFAASKTPEEQKIIYECINEARMASPAYAKQVIEMLSDTDLFIPLMVENIKKTVEQKNNAIPRSKVIPPVDPHLHRYTLIMNTVSSYRKKSEIKKLKKIQEEAGSPVIIDSLNQMIAEIEEVKKALAEV